MNRRLDNHPAYWAFVLHRFSGLVLALFLPAHFYVLALAIEAVGLRPLGQNSMQFWWL